MAQLDKVATAAEATYIENSEKADGNRPLDNANFESFDDEQFGEYRMTWRTGIAVFALALVFGTTVYAIVGPNFSIGSMVQTFPSEAKNANWIATAGLLCAVLLPIVGTTSDRYGKRWFLVAGCVLAVGGSCIAGSAKNLKTIIGGQAITGAGSSLAVVSVPAAMEVVPAKYRPMVFALMGVTSLVGTIGGPFVFASCIQHNVGGQNGWRFGFYIQAILFGTAGCGILIGYAPPPTRFRREQSNKELLKSIDFIGVALLSLGFALTVVALIWGGQTYPWKSAAVITLLVLGPLFAIAMGIYEWKGRRDGIFHHDFFESRNFPIFLCLGAVDGMLLYGLSQFVPSEIRAIYTVIPLDVARTLAFNGGFLCVGYLLIGVIFTKLKKFKAALIATNLLTTVFVGLMVRASPQDKGYFEGMLAAIGILTAANTVVPVGGIALIVPSHLLATSSLILSTVRIIGGVLGLAIFSSVYTNKATVKIPAAVLPILKENGVPEELIPTIISIVLQSPEALAQVPTIPKPLLDMILAATAQASLECYKYVWYCIMSISAACFVLTLFLVDVPERMTNQVETVLETRNLTEKNIDNA